MSGTLKRTSEIQMNFQKVLAIKHIGNATLGTLGNPQYIIEQKAVDVHNVEQSIH